VVGMGTIGEPKREIHIPAPPVTIPEPRVEPPAEPAPVAPPVAPEIGEPVPVGT